jgi:hypothetical protein
MLVAQKESSEGARAKKPVMHLYDDEKIENMVRYYKLGDNYESLLRYIKRHGLVTGDNDSE